MAGEGWIRLYLGGESEEQVSYLTPERELFLPEVLRPPLAPGARVLVVPELPEAGRGQGWEPVLSFYLGRTWELVRVRRHPAGVLVAFIPITTTTAALAHVHFFSWEETATGALQLVGSDGVALPDPRAAP